MQSPGPMRRYGVDSKHLRLPEYATMRPIQYPLLIVLQLATICAFPQGGNLKFEHIGIDAGLSQGNVTCILRDSRGFMWWHTLLPVISPSLRLPETVALFSSCRYRRRYP